MQTGTPPTYPRVTQVWYLSGMVEEVGPATAEAVPVPVKAPVDWRATRIAYEGGDGRIKDICERFGTTRQALYTVARKEGWTRRRPPRPGDRAALIGRMMRVLELQLAKLEQDMTTTGDKEVALLSNMARTLEKLIELDKAERRETRAGGGGRDMSVLRRELAARIDKLAGK